MIERKLKRLVSLVEDFSVGFCWKLFRSLFSEDQKVKHLSNVIEKNSELFLPFFRIPFFRNFIFCFNYLRLQVPKMGYDKVRGSISFNFLL